MSSHNRPTWLSRWGKKAPAARARTRYRPDLEPLETRRVLTRISWSGGGDGSSWNQPSNWAGNKVPGLADDATINVASSTNINLPTGGIAVNSLSQSGGSLTIPSGTVTTTTGLSLTSSTLNLLGGTLSGTSNVLNGTFNETGGSSAGVVSLNNSTFNQSGGIIPGALTVTNGTYNGSGGTITGTATLLNTTTLDLSPTMGSAPFVADGACTLIGTIGASQTVRVEGGLASFGYTSSDASLYFSPGSANLGTITLQSATGSAAASDLAVVAGTTFANAGTIVVNASTAASTITGSFTNAGSMVVNASAQLAVGSTGLAFTQQAGSLKTVGSGELACLAGTFVVSGGAITSGDLGVGGLAAVATGVVADGCSLQVGGTLAAGTTIYADGATTLIADDSAQATVWVEGGLVPSIGLGGNGGAGSAGLTATLTLDPDPLEAGTIVLQSATGSNATSNLAVAPGTTFANLGSVVVNASTAASTITGSFTNAGSMVVNASAQLAVGSTGLAFTQQAGSLKTVGSGELACLAGTFVVSGGAITSGDLGVGGLAAVATGVVADGCSLQVGGTLAAGTTIYADGATTLIADDSAQATVWVEGGLVPSIGLGGNGGAGSAGLTATLTLDPDPLEAGTIVLQSATGSNATSNLVAVLGSTFTNNTSISVNLSNAASTITGNFVNNATFSINNASSLSGTLINGGNLGLNGTSLALLGSTTSLINAPGGQMFASGTITDASGTFTNGGTLSIGSTAVSTLAVTGGFTQTSTGTLNFKLGGTATPGTSFDLLKIGGAAVLAGTLNVTLVSPFLPTIGNAFKIITFASATGTFDTTTGTTLSNGLSLLPSYAATNVTLIASTSPKADLAVTASAQPSPAFLGGNITYSVTVRNNGPNSASGVVLVDTLPAGLTIVSVTPSVGSDSVNGLVVTGNFGTLLSGSSDTLTIVATPAAAGTYVDTATATTSSVDPVASNNTATATATVLAVAADLSVGAVAVPSTVLLGGNISYIVTVTNAGPSVAASLVLTDTLPAGATVVSITPGTGTDTVSGNVVTVNFGDLASGGSVTLTIVVMPNAAGSFTDTASAASATSDPVASNNSASATATVVKPLADLGVTVLAQPAQSNLGGDVTYVVTVANAGPNTASVVSLADMLPGGATVVSITPSVGSFQLNSGVATVSFGDLAAGSSDTLTIVVTPLTAGSYVDTATASAATSDPVASNNSASATATVALIAADLSVAVVATPPQVTLGGNVTYVVTVANAGPSTASAVSLVDTLPAGATVVSIVPSAGTDSVMNGIATASFGDLASGSTATLTIVVAPTAAGTFADSATVGSPTVDPVGSNNSASATATVVLPSADLAVTVAATPPQVTLGGNVTYLVTVANAGPGVASGIVLTDTLPAGVTIVSVLPSVGTVAANGNVETVAIGTLAAKASATLTLVVTPASIGAFVDLASVVTTSSTDPVASNNSASATATVVAAAAASSADLGVVLSGPPAVATSNRLTFVATVTDLGPNDAAGATLVDTFTLPLGATVASATTSQGTSAIVGGVVTVNLGTIASGASAVLTVVLATTVGGTITDSANVGASTGDPLLSNNHATLVLPVSAPDAIAVTASTTSTSLKRPVTVTARVAGLAGFANPTGKVTFLAGTTVLGSVALDASGSASLVVATLPLGTSSIRATYAGDATYAPLVGLSPPVYVGDGLKYDFDGDGKADLAVFGKDPSTGRYDYRILDSSTGKMAIFDNNGYGYGSANSIPIVGDFFGDGRASYALWTPNAFGGMTFTAISPVTGQSIAANFGATTDIPVVADVDGDGKSDFGVYGFASGLNYRFDFLLSTAGLNAKFQEVFNNNGYGYGGPSSIPVVADFDGSGRAGFGLFNPATTGSTFTYVSPTSGVSIARTIGAAGDIPLAVDYDGDGKADLALYGPDPAKPGHYRYLALTSGSGFAPAQAVVFDNNGYGYGNGAAIPVIADYDGTGKADFGLFVPDGKGGSEFVYQVAQTGGGVVGDFATATDIPLSAPAWLLARKVRGA